MFALPSHHGTTFTPIIRASIPHRTDPAKIALPHPFFSIIIGPGKGVGYYIALSFAKAGCSALSISSRKEADLGSA